MQFPTDAINKRFFIALDLVIKQGDFNGLVNFCETYGINRSKHSKLKNNTYMYAKSVVDIRAVYFLSKYHGVSLDYIFFGVGKIKK